MADQANVGSIEKIESLRSTLLLWTERANHSLAEAHEEVSRSRTWLMSDRKTYWLGEQRRRKKALEAAEAELYNVQLSNMQDSAAHQKLVVRRRKVLLDESEEKLRAIKKWMQNFDSRVEPLARKLNSLDHEVQNQMPQAAAYLHDTLRLLSEYASMNTGSGKGAKPAETSESSDPAEDSSDA